MTGCLTGSTLRINLLLNGNTVGISGYGGGTLLNTLSKCAEKMAKNNLRQSAATYVT